MYGFREGISSEFNVLVELYLLCSKLINFFIYLFSFLIW
jgi:hypothetical protein